VSFNFAEIRTACARVAERARFVTIDDGRIAAYAATLDVADDVGWPVGDVDRWGREGAAAFVLGLAAISFGSGWFPTLRKRDGLSGARTIAAGWRDFADEHGPPTAGALAHIDGRTCAALFGQDSGELMDLYAQALNHCGQHVERDYGGSFAALVDDAGGSAARLVEILAREPFYADVAEYDGEAVPLYKRAQLAASDLQNAFGGFTDIAQLTLFADNLVPHVLRLDGVLIVHPEVVARIEAEELLEPGSREEVELRAVAVHAVERLVAARGASTAAAADAILWARGQGARYKGVPRPRVRTVAY
jgi:hypothetical protein